MKLNSILAPLLSLKISLMSGVSKSQFSNHTAILFSFFGIPDPFLSHLLSTNSLQAHHESFCWHELSGFTMNNKDTPIDSENPKDLEGISQEMGIKATPILYSKGFEVTSNSLDKGQTKSLLYNPSMSSIRLQALWKQMGVLLLWIPHNLLGKYYLNL